MSDSFYRTLIDSLYEGVYYVDSDMRITLWNRGAEEITGYSRTEMSGSRCSDNFLRHIDEHGVHLCLEGCPLGKTLKDGLSREAKVFLHHKEGHRLPVNVRIAPIRDEDGGISGAVEVFSRSINGDAVDPLLLNHAGSDMHTLRAMAMTDTVTGLRNRAWAELNLRVSLEQSRTTGIPFSIIVADADHFKRVNDEYGHAVGDRVLKMLGKTLESAVRSTDAVVRWGGEEFLAILPGANRAVLADVAERIRTFVESTWLALEDGTRICITASLGGAMVRPEDTAESLFERADTRMYESKRSGRNMVTTGG